MNLAGVMLRTAYKLIPKRITASLIESASLASLEKTNDALKLNLIQGEVK